MRYDVSHIATKSTKTWATKNTKNTKVVMPF